ncbi:hypothetical protein D3C81_1331200 [compost metagenome]
MFAVGLWQFLPYRTYQQLGLHPLDLILVQPEKNRFVGQQTVAFLKHLLEKLDQDNHPV